jgi:hypothetical protein
MWTREENDKMMGIKTAIIWDVTAGRSVALFAACLFGLLLNPANGRKTIL